MKHSIMTDSVERTHTTLHQATILKEFCYLDFPQVEVSCLICLKTNPSKSSRNKPTPLIPIAGFQHHHQSIEVDQVRLEVAGHLTAVAENLHILKIEIDDSICIPYPYPAGYPVKLLPLDWNLQFVVDSLVFWALEEGVLCNALSVRNGAGRSLRSLKKCALKRTCKAAFRFCSWLALKKPTGNSASAVHSWRF